MAEHTDVASFATRSEPSGYGRDFRSYATGRAVSVVGDRIATIALVFLVIHLSRSYAPALGLFYVCRLLPTLLGGLLAGVFVDHYQRRRLMIGCDLGRALLLGTVPALTSLTLWTLYPTVFVLYTLTLLFDTAADAALPDVVPAGRMMGANAVLQSIETAGDFAYAVGGGLVFVLQFQTPFYIDAATFLFSAAMIATMHIPARPAGPLPRVGEVVQRVRLGIAYLLGQPFLKWSTLTFTVAPFAGGIVFVLLPLYATQILQHSTGLFGPLHSAAFRFSLLEVSIGLGALLGNLLVTRLARRRPRGQIFGAGVLGMGVATALLAATGNLYLAAVFMAASGLCNSLFAIAGMTLLQTLTPTEMRGRVVAARMTVINGSLALGSAVGGALLLVLPYGPLWLLLGCLIGAGSLFVWLRPEVRSQA